MEAERNATISEEQDKPNSPASVDTDQSSHAPVCTDEDKDVKTDPAPLAEGHIEDRFKVDRKKLEKLIQTGGREGESATKYFDRIMSESGAKVLWPSKLKIGAKSKKDPQVKAIGFPDAVVKAKELIMNDLDTKSNRFILKMEVAYSEHSHIIGKGGANVKKVMQDTKCHIHFPDSNRDRSGLYSDKSNQVSISGVLPQVELARESIRQLSPIYLWVDLPTKAHYNDSDYSQPIDEIMTTYNVYVQIVSNPHRFNLQLMVRGTVMYFDGLKLAVAKLTELFMGEIYGVLPVTLSVDIGPAQHQRLIGKGGGNIKNIMDSTETSIQFPDPRTSRKSSVTVYGTMDGVFAARQQLLGCLPLVLMFDIPDETEQCTNPSLVSPLMQLLDVYISVRPKQKQACASVIVKSIEQNAHCMYQTRDRLLQELDKPDVDTTMHTPSPPGGEERHGYDPNLSWRYSGPSSATIDAPYSSFSHSSSESYRKRPSLRSTGKQSSVGETDSYRRGIQDRMPRPLTIATSPFANYHLKKERANKALQCKVTFAELRVPRGEFCGSMFSASMPGSVAKDAMKKKTTFAGMEGQDSPKGLVALHESGSQALLKSKAMGSSFDHGLKPLPVDVYADVTDMASLLEMLHLEKYSEVFHQEEIDLSVLLTMDEEEFECIGISALGARRKLSNAVKELSKRGFGDQNPSVPAMASIPLASKMMCHSGRF